MLVDWKDWDDRECKEAWSKLKSQYSTVDLMYAFYGGLLAGDLSFEGSIVGIKKHFSGYSSIDFSFQKAEDVEETTITFRPKVPLSAFEGIVENHTFDEKERQAHKDVFSDDDMKFVHTEFYLSCKKEQHKK